MIPCFQEKLRKEDVRYPYRKPTQVSEMSILRRVSEISLRNSAKLPRIFGRRGAPLRWGRRKEDQPTV